MAAQIGWGLAGGLVGGHRRADSSSASRTVASWIGHEWRQIVPLAVAIAAYAMALGLGGSGFIAAFVGGMAFGGPLGARGSIITLFTEEAGDFLAAVTWIGFGALVLTLAIPYITWQVVLYAALSLTLVRMIPVAIALAGRGVRRPTVAFLGWFGPRGLASVVFVLLALERGVPDGEVVLTTVVVTVALSVVLHGLTSAPLVTAYHRWYAAHSKANPEAEEATPATVPRPRRQLDAGVLRRLGGSSRGD